MKLNTGFKSHCLKAYGSSRLYFLKVTDSHNRPSWQYLS